MVFDNLFGQVWSSLDLFGGVYTTLDVFGPELGTEWLLAVLATSPQVHY